MNSTKPCICYLLTINRHTYDSVNREMLWNAFITFGISPKLVKTKCKGRFNRHRSNEFEVKTGLPEEDFLSSVLFNIALEIVVKKLRTSMVG